MSDDLKSQGQELIDTHDQPGGGRPRRLRRAGRRPGQPVYLQMGGGCQGCGAADITLKSGIERLIKEEIPEVAEVLDTTDHASGQQPLLPRRQGLARSRRSGRVVMDRLLLLLPTTTYRTEDFVDAARTLGVDLVWPPSGRAPSRPRARPPPHARLHRSRRRRRTVARASRAPPARRRGRRGRSHHRRRRRHRRAAGAAHELGRGGRRAARDKYQMRQCLAAGRRAGPALPLASRRRTIPAWPRRGVDVPLRAQAARRSSASRGVIRADDARRSSSRRSGASRRSSSATDVEARRRGAQCAAGRGVHPGRRGRAGGAAGRRRRCTCWRSSTSPIRSTARSSRRRST